MAYEHLTDVYDRLFPLNETTRRFLLKHLKTGRILDIGAGTGSHALALARAGRAVDGVDLDGSMVSRAREKAAAENLDVRFRIGDMQALTLPRDYYDGVYIIGNTLVHATDENSVKTLFSRLFQALKEDAVFIIQILNYERILKHRITSLPALEQDNASLERTYVHEDDRIVFVTDVSAGAFRAQNRVTLLPLTADLLRTLLSDAGFVKLDTFGSFEEEGYDDDMSYSLVVVAKKGEAACKPSISDVR